nr:MULTISPECIES: helix-turn-helix domain-containing protein [unclassified Frankia]
MAADAAAAELGLSRCRVYELLRRWRAGSDLVSDLIPGKSRGLSSNRPVSGVSGPAARAARARR